MSKAGSPDFELNASGLKVSVITAGWHWEIAEKLLAGSKRALEQANCSQVSFHDVPGAFELPLAASKLAEENHAVIALGVVIRGDTPHFDYVCSAATDGLLRVMLDAQTPIGFGLLTVDNEEQALLRAGEGDDNKGVESVQAALKMALDFN